ncbi:50S ribosomal protein L28 [Candidatus Gracilibacteria bacterium]|nr:50S ribosomal protein L28 [Candidatus Gracilibacteria bacterium]
MSRRCQITGKKGSTGNNRSHAMNATKRRFLPNLVTKKVLDPKTGRMKRMKIATSTLRTLNKTMR